MPAVNAPAPTGTTLAGTHDRDNITPRIVTGTLLNATAPAATELDTFRATVEASRQQEAATAVTINTLQAARHNLLTDLGAAQSDLDEMRRTREELSSQAAALAEHAAVLHARSLAATAQPMQGVETAAGQQQDPVAAAQAAAAALVPSAAGPSAPATEAVAGPGPSSSRSQVDELTITAKEFSTLTANLAAIMALAQFPDDHQVHTFQQQVEQQ
jgi:hypothetical protein